MEKTCKQCNKIFFKPINESKKNWENRHKFCCNKCRYENKIGKPTWNKGIFGKDSHSFGNKNMLGKKASDITKKKMHDTAIRIGNRPPPMIKGTKMSNEAKANMVIAQLKRQKEHPNPKGEKAYHYIDGRTPINHKIRTSIEYQLWQNSVFARDNWTDQKTGVRGIELHAHHIQNFSSHPELRFAIDNGITLSKESHKLFHKLYGRKNNTMEQLQEFLTNA